MMKKALPIALALLILLSLTAFPGCQTAEPAAPAVATAAPATAAPATAAPAQPEPTAAPLDLAKTKPCEYVKEKLAAGMEVIVACSMIADVPVLMEVWAGEIKAKLEPEGITFLISAANLDMGVMISQIENYTTMGAACIMCLPTDGATVKDAVLKAMEKGTQVIAFGVSDADYCFSVRSDTHTTGTNIGGMAASWIKYRYPDATQEKPVKVAALRNGEIADKVIQDDAMIAAVEKYGPGKVVFTVNGVEGSLEAGMNVAQNALTYDPEIRVFITHAYTIACGVSNYIISQPDLDPSEFASFGSDEDTVAIQMINEQSPKNEAVLRGCSISPDSPGVCLGNAALAVVYGEQKAPYEFTMLSVPHTDGTYTFKQS